jgi:hypothetical protein
VGADAVNPFCRQGECNRACKASGYDGGDCVQGDCVCFIEVIPVSS